jgi:putative pyruvate formate lyase activating enzyme
MLKNPLEMLRSCAICPRKCRVNRLEGQTGFCKIADQPIIYSSLAHHGEEPPISGERGSGTIFFSGCNMACVYCQNYEFSQTVSGKTLSFAELADTMLELQDQGCHNINLVTPTHVMPQILAALAIAKPKGLKIPIVYNTGGYELAEIIALLNGIVDVYLVDMRYGSDQEAEKYSAAPGYARFNRAAIKEMHQQVGIAKFDSSGIIKKGLIIRHLVLPENISRTEKVMRFIAENISPDTYISLMSQYTPFHKAAKFSEINRRINDQEYAYAQEIMEKYGLHNGWTQEARGLEKFAGVNIKTAFSE